MRISGKKGGKPLTLLYICAINSRSKTPLIQIKVNGLPPFLPLILIYTVVDTILTKKLLPVFFVFAVYNIHHIIHTDP